jgi:TRAP transporter TAXI family solute receptor
MKMLSAAAAIGLSALVAAPAAAQQLGIGTMGQGTSGYSMGSAIARVLSENGVDALVQPSAGTSAYLPLIDMGELDIGIANAIEVGDAVAGEGAFDGRALANLRPIARLYPFRVGVFVRDDSDIQTIADLKGASITYGFSSQVTLNRVLQALLATGGLTEADIEPVLVPNVVRGADDFSAGRVDAAFFAMGSGKVAEADAAVGGLRFLPVSDAPEAVARMQAILPQAYVTKVQPVPNLAGVDEPINAMAYDYMLVAGAHVSDERVAEIVRLLHDNKDALAESFGGFRSFRPDAMHVDIGVPYHDGAVAAYKVLGQ